MMDSLASLATKMPCLHANNNNTWKGLIEVGDELVTRSRSQLISS
jgi:hypothetical protein